MTVTTARHHSRSVTTLHWDGRGLAAITTYYKGCVVAQLASLTWPSPTVRHQGLRSGPNCKPDLTFADLQPQSRLDRSCVWCSSGNLHGLLVISFLGRIDFLAVLVLVLLLDHDRLTEGVHSLPLILAMLHRRVRLDPVQSRYIRCVRSRLAAMQLIK